MTTYGVAHDENFINLYGKFNNACLVSDVITIRIFVSVEQRVRNDFNSGCTSWASFYE